MPPSSRAPRARVDRALIVGARAHFDDPAYYAKTYAERREDIRYYEAIVAPGARVLEYGVGAGRIAIPLARRGARVVGVDWSRPMLDDLARRLARERGDVRARVRAVHGDMREVSLRARFDLVLVTFNTFLHLYTRDDVERFLSRARRHLAREGSLVIDVSVPHPGDLARDPDRLYRAPRLRHPTTGQLVRYGERFDYDASRQILFVTSEFEPVDGAPPFAVPLAHRQYFPEELSALLHYNGFEVTGVEGGFEGEALTRHSDVMILTARAQAARARRPASV